LHDATTPTVFDRLFHGELVYGPLCRGASRLSPYQAQYLELEAADCLVIWCYASPERLVARGDPIYRTVKVKDLLDRYLFVRESSRLEMCLYDSDRMLPTDLDLPCPTLRAMPGRWVGGEFAGVTLVGERFPGSLPHWSSERWQTDLAHFRPFDDSRSGDYLLKALAGTSYRPRDLRIVNAVKQDMELFKGREQLRLETLGTRVIALGNDAEDELTRAKVKVDAKIPHPQFWSRFHHAELGQYVELLNAAL
jgi:hypothetical protein